MNLDDIKYNRFSASEMFLLDIFDGIVEYIPIDNSDQIYYKKNDIVMFKYNSKTQHLLYSMMDIWCYCHSEFDLDFDEIQFLVKTMVVEYFITVVIYIKPKVF